MFKITHGSSPSFYSVAIFYSTDGIKQEHKNYFKQLFLCVSEHGLAHKTFSERCSVAMQHETLCRAH